MNCQVLQKQQSGERMCRTLKTQSRQQLVAIEFKATQFKGLLMAELGTKQH
jgi:hypothetical protein